MVCAEGRTGGRHFPASVASALPAQCTLHIGEVVLPLKLLLTKLLQHLVDKEKLLMLEPFNLSYHGHILHGLELTNYNAVSSRFMSTFLRWLILFFIPSSPPP